MSTRPEEKKIDSPFTMTSGDQHNTFGALFRNGARITDLSDIRRNPDADNSPASRAADVIREGCVSPFPSDSQLLNLIPREKFFGVRSWVHLFGMDMEDDVPLPPIDIPSLFSEACPFNPEKKVGETHFLFVIPEHFEYHPATNAGLRDWLRELKLVKIKKDQFIRAAQWDPSVTEEEGLVGSIKEYVIPGARWMLIYLGIMPGSDEGKSREEQLRMIPHKYRPATLLEAHLGLNAFDYTQWHQGISEDKRNLLKSEIYGRVMEEDIEVTIDSLNTHYGTDRELFDGYVNGMFIVRPL